VEIDSAAYEKIAAEIHSDQSPVGIDAKKTHILILHQLQQLQQQLDRIEKRLQSPEQPNNPLHGVKLVDILEHLVEKFGWEELGSRININCFNSDPSIKSSLKFLRKTEWARAKVERLYLRSIKRSRRG